jgi:hypothetical protein
MSFARGHMVWLKLIKKKVRSSTIEERTFFFISRPLISGQI